MHYPYIVCELLPHGRFLTDLLATTSGLGVWCFTERDLLSRPAAVLSLACPLSISTDMFIEGLDKPEREDQHASRSRKQFPAKPRRGSCAQSKPLGAGSTRLFTRNLNNANVLYRHGVNERLDRNNGGDIIVNVDRRKSWRRQGNRTNTLIADF